MPLLADNLRNLQAYLTVAAVIVAALVLGRDLLIPLALATIIAFMLAPLVRELVRAGLPQAIAASMVLASVLGVSVAATIVLSSQVLELAADLSSYRQNLIDKVRTINGMSDGSGVIERASQAIESLESAVRRELTNSQDVARAPSEAGNPNKEVVVSEQKGYLDRLSPFGHVIGQAALTLLFTAFLVFQHQDLRDRVVRIAGVSNLSGTTGAMIDAGDRLSRMFLAQAVMNAGFGLFMTAVLFVLGVPNAILWGVCAAVFRFIPFIGTYLAIVPPVVLAAGVDPGWGTALTTLAVFAAAEIVMGQIVEPLWLGKQTGISPFAMIVSASFWTLVWGPIGLLLAAPLTVLLVVLGRYIPALEMFHVLLGDQAALTRAEEFYSRLLGRDSGFAVAQIEAEVEDTSLPAAADQIVLPALGLAASDYRRGRLDDDRLAGAQSVMREVTFVADQEIAGKLDSLRSRSDQAPQALVVPGRGPIDAMASEFVARSLAAVSTWRISSAHNASGLTALSSRGGLQSDAVVNAVIIVTVGGVEGRHLEIIIERATQSFPEARILTIEANRAAKRSEFEGPTAATDPRIARRTRLTDITDLLLASANTEPSGAVHLAQVTPETVVHAI